ncbi:hypothetical protein ACIA8E_00750 [Streptomyces sp. NPDC051664]|uniref:hypothetical protein n=1 Tax=Streptomyces sp. NPDC051664 TaxID=3365668 RepID=UPI0037A694F9
MRTYVRCVHGRANSRIGGGGPVHPIGDGAARLPAVGIRGDLAAAHRPAVIAVGAVVVVALGLVVPLRAIGGDNPAGGSSPPAGTGATTTPQPTGSRLPQR